MSHVSRLSARPRLLGGVALGVLAVLHFVFGTDAYAGYGNMSDARLKRDIRPV